MWTCRKCGELLEDQFESCWKCGSSNPAGKAAGAAEFPNASGGPAGISIATHSAERSGAEVTGAGVQLTEPEVKAFVGPNAEFYLRKWDAALKGGDKETGFNWAAFFLSAIWLSYRKLYLHAIAFYAFMLLLVLVEAMARPQHHGSGIGLLLGVVCGVFGNRWYLVQARTIIAKLRSRGLEGEAYLGSLARQGGTSPLAAVGFFMAFFALVYLCLLALR